MTLAATLWGLHVLDLAVLVVYLIATTALGIWMARFVKSINDFAMPRRFGKAMMMMHSFGTGTDPHKAVTVASVSFKMGISGIWYQWLWLFCTPFYWLFAPMMRRFRALTTADVFEYRFSRGVSVLYALIGVFTMMISLGNLLKASGGAISGATGGQMPETVAIIGMSVLFVAYGVAGGLAGAIVTDFIQGILTVVFSFLLLPYILGAVGGMEGIADKLADAPKMLSMVAPGKIGVFYITVLAINALIGNCALPHTMGICGAGRTERDGAFGFMAGNFIKRVCTCAWALTGLAAMVYFHRMGKDPALFGDNAYGAAAAEFLVPGLLGIFLATMLAAVMSSCDSFMIASSALFTENIYRKLVPDRLKPHYVRAARISAVSIVAGGILFAYWIPDLKAGLEIFFQVPAMMGIVFWMGIFWRRTTPAGAWAAALTAIGCWWLCTQGWFIGFIDGLPVAEYMGLTTLDDGKLIVYLPWQMIFYTVIGLTSGIVVSLLTRPINSARLENFYGLLRTPVRPGEVIDEPMQLPAGTVPGPRRVMVDLKNFEIPRPSVSAMTGFLIGCALVVALIYGFMWITGL